MAHELTPGRSGRSPQEWAASSSLKPRANHINILMVVHPRCPCTRSSLIELAEALKDSPARVSARLLVFRPPGESPNWPGPSFFRAASAVPGAEIVDDPGGVEASRFGLETSGTVVAFDARGRRRYCGGLTSARGKVGPSEGGRALRSLLAGSDPELRGAPVFGCGLGRVAEIKLARGRQP
jgi:hypothetical protein